MRVMPTGDRGQRYEVRCTDGNGAEMVVGWCEDSDGGPLRRCVELHPSWHSPVVIDRRVDCGSTGPRPQGCSRGGDPVNPQTN